MRQHNAATYLCMYYKSAFCFSFFRGFSVLQRASKPYVFPTCKATPRLQHYPLSAGQAHDAIACAAFPNLSDPSDCPDLSDTVRKRRTIAEKRGASGVKTTKNHPGIARRILPCRTQNVKTTKKPGPGIMLNPKALITHRIISLPGLTHLPEPGLISDTTCRILHRKCIIACHIGIIRLPGPEIPNIPVWNLRSWKLSISWRQFGVNRSIQLFLFRGFPHRFSSDYFIAGLPDNRSTLKLPPGIPVKFQRFRRI